MGKYAAQANFDQMAVEYLETTQRYVEGNKELTAEQRVETVKSANELVNRLRREHNYALEGYYGTDRHKHMRKAMRNDTKGLT